MKGHNGQPRYTVHDLAEYYGMSYSRVHTALMRKDAPQPERPFAYGNRIPSPNVRRRRNQNIRYYDISVVKPFFESIGIKRKPPMKQYDLVQPNNFKTILSSGANKYTSAVVVCVVPFILVSENGDMVWQGQQRENFDVIGEASEEVISSVKKRIMRDPRLENYR